MGLKIKSIVFIFCLGFLLATAKGMGLRPKQATPAPAPTPSTQPVSTGPVEATQAAIPDKVTVEQDRVYSQAGQLVSRFLQEQHFARHPIDALVSAEWVKAYMKSLDYNHLFFLKSDLDAFGVKYAPDVGSDLRKGKLTQAYDIFQIFRERVNSRLLWVNKRFNQPFDFTTQDYYQPDRSKAEWPQTVEEADALWECRLKFEVLADRLAEKKKAEDSVKHLKKRYEVLQKNLNETDREDVVTAYFSSLSMLYDPHSVYLGPKEEEDFAISMKLQLVGIGAVLSTEDGYCTIKEIIAGGPADLDKRLHPGDRIVGVAQGDGEFVDIIDMKLRNAVRLIRGDKNTVVRLNVLPAALGNSATHEEVKLVRDQVKIASQKAKAKLIRQTAADGQEYKIGVIELPSFYGNIGDSTAGDDPGNSSSTTDDVAALVKKLKEKNIDGLVLDLRNNGGGLLSEAVRLVGLFIGKGPVVQVKDSQGRKQVLQNFDSNIAYDGPLMVLTNKLSASASEIAAGALQNYGRALIIGDKSTHGKGTVQTVAELNHFIPPVNGLTPDAGAMKITIQKFYLPNGHSTQQRGVIPDIILPSPNDYLELGESNLPHSLPWDEIEPATFSKWPADPAGFINSLNTSSQQRIAQDSDFKLLLGDIDRLRKRMEDRRISLNESERQTEAAQDKKRKQERDKMVKAMTARLPDILTITFDNKKGLIEELASQEKPKAKSAPEGSEDEESGILPKAGTAESYATDLLLRESLRIFGDWLKLSDKKGPMTALHEENKPKPQ